VSFIVFFSLGSRSVGVIAVDPVASLNWLVRIRERPARVLMAFGAQLVRDRGLQVALVLLVLLALRWGWFGLCDLAQEPFSICLCHRVYRVSGDDQALSPRRVEENFR
jgi:hypothetical protein